MEAQFQCLAREGGVSRVAAEEHTRELDVVLGIKADEDEEEPRLPSVVKTSKGGYNFRAVVRERARSLCESLQALQVFNKVESVLMYNCNILLSHQRGITIGLGLKKFLESLPNLRSAHFSPRWSNVSMKYWIGLRLGNLQHLVIRTHPWKDSGEGDMNEALYTHAVLQIMSAAPGITELELGYPWKCFLPRVRKLFGVLNTLKLRMLCLQGWEFDEASAKDLPRHCAQLQELRIGWRCRGAQFLWPELQAAGIKLQALHAKGWAGEDFFQYVASFSGLQELSMSNERDSSSSLGISCAIGAHTQTLRELDILCTGAAHWHYGDEIAEVVGKCVLLKSLAISVLGADVTSLLRAVSSQLLLLEVLHLEPVTREIALKGTMSQCIRSFPLPQKSRLREIDWYSSARQLEDPAFG